MPSLQRQFFPFSAERAFYSTLLSHTHQIGDVCKLSGTLVGLLGGRASWKCRHAERPKALAETENTERLLLLEQLATPVCLQAQLAIMHEPDTVCSLVWGGGHGAKLMYIHTSCITYTRLHSDKYEFFRSYVGIPQRESAPRCQ